MGCTPESPVHPARIGEFMPEQYIYTFSDNHHWKYEPSNRNDRHYPFISPLSYPVQPGFRFRLGGRILKGHCPVQYPYPQRWPPLTELQGDLG